MLLISSSRRRPNARRQSCCVHPLVVPRSCFACHGQQRADYSHIGHPDLKITGVYVHAEALFVGHNKAAASGDRPFKILSLMSSRALWSASSWRAPELVGAGVRCHLSRWSVCSSTFTSALGDLMSLRRVVAIGASEGESRPLQTVVAGLPQNFPAA